MKLKIILFAAALAFFGALPAFAAQADHSSSMGVATSLVKALKTGDFECFNDALTPRSRELVAAQEDPQKLFAELSRGVKQALAQVPEEQRPLISMLLISQFQRMARKIDDKWFFDLHSLAEAAQ